MGDQNKNVPRLRFPGYTDAWVKCEFATFIERINISSDSDLIPKVVRWYKKGFKIDKFYELYPEFREEVEKIINNENNDF